MTLNGCHGDPCNTCTCQGWDQLHWYLPLSTISTAMKVLIIKSFLYFYTVLVLVLKY